VDYQRQATLLQREATRILCAMKNPFRLRYWRLASIAVFLLGVVTFLGWRWCAYAQDKSQFPDGFDAVQAAPNSHKVVFENASFACWT